MSTARKTSRISIIIPALNEEGELAATLDGLPGREDLEVLVVDGGSRDRTVTLARRLGARVLHSTPGRARQMNVGGARARGEILLFLHADTRLPAGFAEAIRRCLAAPGTAAGAFRLGIAGPGLGLRLTEKMVQCRCKLMGLPYGDQGLFLRRALFREMGGYPEMPLLEDYVLVRRLRRKGRIVILPLTASTSPRRWQEQGVIRNAVRNFLIIAGYLLGVSPERLARWYRRSQQ